METKRCIVSVSIEILLVTSAIAHAQESPQPKRVRFSSGGDFRVGTLVSADRDSIVICDAAGRTVAAPSHVISEFEQSEGRDGHPGLGAVVGGLSGLVVGALIARENGGGGFGGVDAGDVAPVFIGGLLGAGAGALVGTFIKTEQWEPVPRPWSFSVACDGSVGLALTISLGDPLLPRR